MFLFSWSFVLPASLLIAVYLLFKDTLNRIQYVERLRLYWITRDTGTKGQPLVRRAFMRQVAEPYWRGEGIEIRLGKSLTFQVGLLTVRVDSLESQIGGRDALGVRNLPAKALRNWGMRDE